MRRVWSFGFGLLVCLGSSTALAGEFFVAPNGSSSGDGSTASPWDLATALSHPSSVQPGDTIWLAGGTYKGIFTSNLIGTAAAPIVVRAQSGERVTIDGGDSGGEGILSVGGGYSWYWGFEVMSSDPIRTTTETGSSPTSIKRGGGVQTVQSAGTAVGVKFINLVIHDTRQGISFWKDSTESEIYGCLIYYNGWDAPDRGHGHGIYTQNDTGTKTIRDNIVFHQFSYGIHAYGSDNAYLKNFTIDGNVVFDNGVLAVQNSKLVGNILLGGESGPNGYSIVSGGKIIANATYSFDGALGGHNNVGYSAGCSSDVSITDNVFAQETALRLVSCSGASVTGNTLIGGLDGFSESDYPSNTYASTPPAQNLVIVRKNEYEPGRAHVAIYNWENKPSVSVDLAPAGLATGSSYEVRDVLDYFGTPVKSGSYDGSPIEVPMTGLTPSTPVGAAKPPHSAPGFGAFIVSGTPGASGSGGAAGTGGGAGSGGSSAGGGGKGSVTNGGSGGQTTKKSDSDDDSGCGCRVPVRTPNRGAIALFVLIALSASRSWRSGRAGRSTTR